MAWALPVCVCVTEIHVTFISQLKGIREWDASKTSPVMAWTWVWIWWWHQDREIKKEEEKLEYKQKVWKQYSMWKAYDTDYGRGSLSIF